MANNKYLSSEDMTCKDFGKMIDIFLTVLPHFADVICLRNLVVYGLFKHNVNIWTDDIISGYALFFGDTALNNEEVFKYLLSIKGKSNLQTLIPKKLLEGLKVEINGASLVFKNNHWERIDYVPFSVWRGNFGRLHDMMKIYFPEEDIGYIMFKEDTMIDIIRMEDAYMIVDILNRWFNIEMEHYNKEIIHEKFEYIIPKLRESRDR